MYSIQNTKVCNYTALMMSKPPLCETPYGSLTLRTEERSIAFVHHCPSLIRYIMCPSTITTVTKINMYVHVM